MAFIPVPNGLRVAVEYRLNGQLVVNVYYLETEVAVTSVNLAALASIFVDWWTTNMRQNFTTSMALERIVVTDVSVANGLQEAQSVAPVIPGTAATAPAPNSVAVVVSHRTGYSGRSFRGRTYLAGFSASEVADNYISAALAANIVSDMLSLRSALFLAGHKLSVASFRANGVPRSVAVLTNVTSFVINTRIDTQRRRLPGVGT